MTMSETRVGFTAAIGLIVGFMLVLLGCGDGHHHGSATAMAGEECHEAGTTACMGSDQASQILICDAGKWAAQDCEADETCMHHEGMDAQCMSEADMRAMARRARQGDAGEPMNHGGDAMGGMDHGDAMGGMGDGM